MNKPFFFFFFISIIFAPILSNSCSEPDLLYIINHGTGYFLGVDFPTRILELDTKNPLEGLDENNSLPANEELAGNQELSENENQNVLTDDKQANSQSEVPNYKIVLNYLFQKWCFHDITRTFYNNLEPPNKYSDSTTIVLDTPSAHFTKVLGVMNGDFSKPVFDLLPYQNSFYATFRISYLPKSGLFSIRTIIGNELGLALSAVSSNHAHGITLKPFSPRNPLQQWIIQP